MSRSQNTSGRKSLRKTLHIWRTKLPPSRRARWGVPPLCVEHNYTEASKSGRCSSYVPSALLYLVFLLYAAPDYMNAMNAMCVLLFCWAWLYSFCSVTLRSGQTCCYYEANFNLLCYLLRFFWCWPWLLYDIADICIALIPVLVILVECLCISCDTMCWVWLCRSRYMHIHTHALILLLHVLILWQLSH